MVEKEQRGFALVSMSTIYMPAGLHGRERLNQSILVIVVVVDNRRHPRKTDGRLQTAQSTAMMPINRDTRLQLPPNYPSMDLLRWREILKASHIFSA